MNKENEIWKDVPGFEGYYRISNMGRLMRVGRVITDKNGRNKFVRGGIKSVKHSGGWYLTVPLCSSGGIITVRIHQLVAEVFIGPKPTSEHHVHHKDGNKQNNRVGNLEYILPKLHSKITAKENPNLVKGMNHYNKVVKTKKIIQYDLNGNLITEHLNGHEASVFSGVCQRNILQVANQTEYKPGKARKHAGGFIWKFKSEENVVECVGQ